MTRRNHLDQSGYGSTPADQRFALIAALLGGAWFFGLIAIFNAWGWL